MYLVTGGSGYFGETLTKKLLDQGHRVRIFDLNLPSFAHANLEYFKGDICDSVAINTACEGVQCIQHNVAQVPIAKDRKLFWDVNHGGTKNLLEAAFSKKVQKVIYTSSSAVYGVPKKNPVTEADAPCPAEAYGKAKYSGELLCKEYIEKGLDTSIIRPRTILGHGRLGIFQILFEWIYQNANIPVLGKGENIYQFVHADDLADACIRAGDLSGPDIFNIGTDRYGSMSSVLSNLITYAHSTSKIRHIPFRLAVLGMNITSVLGLSPLGAYHSLMYGRSMYFNISHAQKKLNFAPRYSNDEMFQDSYKWYLEHREAILSGKYTGSKHQSALKEGVLSLVRKII